MAETEGIPAEVLRFAIQREIALFVEEHKDVIIERAMKKLPETVQDLRAKAAKTER